MDELLLAITDALERKGMSAAAASEMAVGNPSAIKNLINRRNAVAHGKESSRNHPIENLLAVASVLGLELYLGPPRNNDSSLGDHAGEFAFVDRFDVSLSAGPGQNGDNARRLAPVAFRKDWMADRGLPAEKCVVVGVSGQSMEPLLYDGDLALLNRQHRTLRNKGVYGIIDVEGDVRVKRIEKVEEGIILRSDNPDFPSELRLGEDANRVQIIGAIEWSGHNHNPLRQISK